MAEIFIRAPKSVHLHRGAVELQQPAVEVRSGNPFRQVFQNRLQPGLALPEREVGIPALLFPLPDTLQHGAKRMHEDAHLPWRVTWQANVIIATADSLCHGRQPGQRDERLTQ